MPLWRSALDILEKADTWLILIHEKPDGDAVGSAFALADRCRKLGKRAIVAGPDPVPASLCFLQGNIQYYVGPVLPPAVISMPNKAFVIVDTSNPERTCRLPDALQDRSPIVVVDHHGDNTFSGNCNIVDPKKTSTAEVLWELYRFAGWKPSRREAEALYAAIITDTGNFRFQGVSPWTHIIASELIASGADPSRIYGRIYENREAAGLRLWGKALEGISLCGNGKVCMAGITREDFNISGASGDETENLVNLLLTVRGVKVGVLMVEEDSCVRVSIRTRDEFNARTIAQRWGGGGHPRAAGCRIPGGLHEAQTLITESFGNGNG